MQEPNRAGVQSKMIVQLGGWSVHATPYFSIGSLTSNSSYPGAARRMRTRIGLLAQPESMLSIIGATQ
jgi:hypothetical protein